MASAPARRAAPTGGAPPERPGPGRPGLTRPGPRGSTGGRPGRRGVTRRQRVAGSGLALPFLLIFTVFMAGPVLASAAMSFTDLRSADLRNPLAVDPVGMDNYVRLLGDETLRRAAANTAWFVLLGVPLTMVLGLAAAVALDAGISRFRTFFRVGYYLPVVTSIVAVAVVWRFLLEPDSGLVNTLLARLGVDGPAWLSDTRTALPSLVVMAAWRNMGFLMVVFLAGLQAIPGELHEAAAIDGCGAWARFRHVTLPLLRPTLLFGGVVTGIGYLQFFEEPFVMTGGGPLDSTLSVAFYIYQQFGFGNYGYAAAIAYVLFVAVVGLTAAQFRLMRSKT
ncbi:MULTISPECIES: carbohydrate ABC transporter permease [unclassified Micromonospora]|uniref:carbohydrate ABC transporter permease n=1 Tax=unclassified Micromonospora TaxID=2617518 RepID=UPI00098D2746|nr:MULTISPECIES: sugar ABC transporter permease [unclassified Micromonospora]MDI5938804.1 sugar ABC transporter permease [Micromonospora sp. DH15]